MSLAPNAEGFLRPKINAQLCTECEQCRRRCPALASNYEEHSTPDIIAYASKGAALQNSSSGGAFSLLAQWVYGQKGFVAGAVWADQFEIQHVLTHSEEELDSIRFSKYAQSNPGTCYTEVKQALEDGRIVLYSGCPCQVAGLRNFIGCEHENLYTIDLLCHGVPSPRDLRDYLDETWGLDAVADVRMRRTDGWGTCMHVELNDGSRYNNVSKNDLYLNAFLSDINLRDCCYGCKFARIPRVGDITLGDFWSAKSLKLGDPYEKRSSLVLLNSPKGNKLWQAALASAKEPYCSVRLEPDALGKLNKNVTQPTTTDRTSRLAYRQHRATMSFTEAARETLFPFDVGLLLFASDNYGSAATNIALLKAIEALGHKPVVLDSLIEPNGVSAEYLREHAPMSSNYVKKGNYKIIDSLCDTFVIGSDQSLRWDFGRVKKNLELFLMGFTSDSKRRIAYASSFGPERYKLSEDMRLLYQAMLKRFQAISVREDYAVKMCDKLFGVKAVQTLDPVFLLDKRAYEDMAQEADVDLPERYLLAYIRYASPEKRAYITECATKRSLEPIVICDASSYEELRSQLGMDAIIMKPSFEEWLAYFAHASYVITDSFHGTCFSIIFEKEFTSVKAGTTRRFGSLARLLCDTHEQAKQLFVSDDKELADASGIHDSQDFAMFARNLAPAREASRTWLKSALESELPNGNSNDNEFLVSWARTLKRKNELEAAAKKAGDAPGAKSGSKTLYKRARRFAGRKLRAIKKLFGAR